MQLIDTHTHIYCEEFDEDLPLVLQRSLAAQVDTLLLPAIDSDTYDRLEALQAPQLSIHRMMGLHPTSVKADWRMQLAEAERRLFAHPERYVAVGEVGLDYYWDRTYEREQLEALEVQMQWAERLALPLSLHVRKAYEEALHLVRGRGVMHCFGGDTRQAFRAIDRGFLIGVGGVVTFKNAGLAEVVKAIPLESILLETDAPYLAPVPYRGRRNEPARILDIARRVAELKEVPLEQVADQTTRNAKKLFDI